MTDIVARLRDYLGNGGFFNPELMDHAKVRDMVMDCRDEIERLRAELAAERERGWNAHAANLSLTEDNDALRAQLAEACGALEAVSAGLHSVRPTINVACIDLTSIRRARAVLEKIKGGGDE